MIGCQFVLCALGLLTVHVWADTPANCTYSDIVGKWIFYEGTRNFDSSIKCNNTGFVKRKIRVDLKYPNYAVDEYGNLGRWTMVYNQGFEVTVNGRTFFAFSYFTKKDDNVTSFCDRTFPSWSHDVTLRHWACFFGRKATPVPPKYHADPFSSLKKLNETIPLEDHEALVERINSVQSSWTATVYPRFVNMTHEELLRISGGRKSWLPTRPSPKPATDFLKDSVSRLPSSFDWRDVEGVNFVSPVRNQGSCGSCYAFSSMGQLESRIRVRTNNTLKLQLSPQDVVSCSKLAQGCEGGFPYLVAGKYGQEYGTVEERCNPYEGQEGPCTGRNCLKHYTAYYGYVGGYYGACNEQQMIMDLIHDGPISVSFEVYPDFRNYKGGVYRHLSELEYNPFVLVNHAVLLVGYGVDESTGDKYWIVKNSWGADWGENGYFRILRGTNECGIESTAVYVIPIP